METEQTPKPPKAKRKKSTTPRSPKTIDPGIKAIRERMAGEVKAYRSAKASGKILDTFIKKRLPKLMPSDRQKLFDALSATETPALPITPKPSPEFGGDKGPAALAGLAP